MALQREEYLHYGIISALSVLQGSPGPVMFAAPVEDYIVYGKLDSVSVSCVPKHSISVCFAKVHAAYFA